MGVAPVARAQSPESEARALFQSGREAMAREDYATACPQLERSEALDPGIGTAFNLARCYELWDRLASAWGAYERVVRETHAAGESQREEVARGLMLALEPRLSRVTVVVRDANAPGLEIRLDGARVERTKWATPLPVDIGEHRVDAVAAGAPPFASRFVVERDAQNVDIAVPPFVAPTAPTAPGPVQPSPWRSTIVESRSTGDVQRWSAFGAGGLALVSAGIGTYFGLHAKSLWSEASPYCGAGSCGDPYYSTTQNARSSADAATIAFAVGGALLTSAVVLYLTSPHPHAR
jgi:hypothetical protein